MTEPFTFVSIRPMAKVQKSSGGSGRSKASSKAKSKQHKDKKLAAPPPQRGGVEMVDHWCKRK